MAEMSDSKLRICAALILLVALGAGLSRSTSQTRLHSDTGNLALSAPHSENEALLTQIAVGAMLDPNAPQPVWDAVLNKKPQLFIFMGDILDASAGATDRLNSAYEKQVHHKGFQRLRQTVAVLPVWNDFESETASGAVVPVSADARATFMSFWHVPAQANPTKRVGLYDAVAFGTAGRRVQIIRLDLSNFHEPSLAANRSEELVASIDDSLPTLAPVSTMLDAEQWKWLESELKRDADLRLVVSPIPVLSTVSGVNGWNRVPKERQRLFDLIAAVKANGVVFLTSGDGQGALYRQERGLPYSMFELAVGSLNHARESRKDESDESRLGPAYARSNFGLVEIDWPRHTVRLALCAEDGTAIEPQASVPLAVLKVANVAGPVAGPFVPGD